ncbi:MAG: peptidase MA family metallohydrolase [Syntrophomonas sp.]|nr:peptidase MA family metallohydrolase [Syntrophomonas sp.]
MSGIKGVNNTWLALVIMALAILGLYLSKNGGLTGQVRQDLMRFMVGQETNFRTGQWDELQTEHYIIKYLPLDEDGVKLVAESAEEAYTSVSSSLGRQPAKQTTIVIYPDNMSLAASFGWDKNEKALGVYWGGTIRILSPNAWLSDLGQRERFVKEGPMVHEFTHLIVDEMTKGNYNRWWTEGIAQYTEKKITGFEFADPFAGGQKFHYYTLENLEKNFDSLDQSVAYWESLQAVDFLVNSYGEEKLYTILRYLGNGDSMTKATEKALGIDYKTFAEDFYQYLENN